MIRLALLLPLPPPLLSFRIRRCRLLLVVSLVSLGLILTGCKDKRNVKPVGSLSVDPSMEAGRFRFEDATQQLKLKQSYDNGESANERSILETIGGGVAVFDYDRDGFEDLYFAAGGKLDNKTVSGLGGALWRSLQGKEFQTTTQLSGTVCSEIYSHGTTSGDLNNDGFADLLITGYFGLALFVNQGDGTFLEQSQVAGLTDPSWGTSSAFGDFDSDGNLDIYIAHYVNWSFSNHPPCKSSGQPDVCTPGIFTGLSDVVWMNNGDGTFARKSQEIGLAIEGKGLGVIVTDFTQDSQVDIYVANDGSNNLFYLNKGGTFDEIGLANGTAVDDMGTPQGSMGLCTLDFDSDSLPDIMVCNYENQAFALYKNDGGANFRYATSTTGLMALGTTYVAWGTAACDFDLDGDEDVIIANGHVMRGSPPEQLPLLLQNLEGAKFLNFTFPEGNYFQKKWRGRGVVAFDLEHDGDLDLCFTHILQDASLLFNTTESANNWWIVELVGTKSNRDAIGARVLIKTSKRTILRNIVGGGSYLSQNPYYIHWGAPQDETIESIEVVWPSGIKQVIGSLPARTRTVIHESNS